MSWVLVVIALLGGEKVETTIEGIYSQFDECFDARDQVIVERWENYEGFPEVNHQVVCIRSDKY